MPITRAHSVERTLFEMPQAEAKAWTRWLTIHQLDPDRIPIGRWILIDDDHRTIEATYFVIDQDGRLKLTDGHPTTEHVIRQLESKALPFPGRDDHETRRS